MFPVTQPLTEPEEGANPQARGCSCPGCFINSNLEGESTGAGMFLIKQGEKNAHSRRIHRRGDVPEALGSVWESTKANPQARGCSGCLGRVRTGVPGESTGAGMFRTGAHVSWDPHRRIHRRGDVPCVVSKLYPLVWANPQARGCSAGEIAAVGD